MTDDPRHDQWLQQLESMPATTANEFPGWRVTKVLGVVAGVVARSAGFSRLFSASFASLSQGEVHEITEVMEQARRDAYLRLKANAARLGANAVLGVKFDSSDTGNGITELVAYGTAVNVVAQS
jgi:uncharacterized protein YbjQ (UPF0145 family)